MSKEQLGSNILWVERIALALTLFLVPIVWATGLSRFEVAKMGLLGVLGGVVVVSWLVAFARLGKVRVLGAGSSAILALVLLLWAAASLLWSPSAWESLESLLLWTTLIGVLVSAASPMGSPLWIGLPLVSSGFVVALTVLLQRAGLPFPEIPTGMAHDALAHGCFDHALFAGQLLAMTTPLGLYLAADLKGWQRAVLLLGVLVGAVTVGLTGTAPAVFALVALVIGGLLAFPSLKGRAGSPWLWTALVLAIALVPTGRFGIGALDAASRQADDPEERQFGSLLVEQLQDVHRMEPAENAVTSVDEYAFEWNRVFSDWGQSRLFGTGVGTWAYHAGLGVVADSSYYQRDRGEFHVHETPQGWFLGLWSELGWPGLIIWLLALAGLLAGAIKGLLGREPGTLAGAGFLVGTVLAAAGLGLTTASPYHAGEGVAIFAVLGLGAALDRKGGGPAWFGPRVIPPARGLFQRFERWVLVGIPVLAILVPALWVTARATVSNYYRQYGELLFYASQPEESISALERAESIWAHDERTQYLLGTVRFFAPSDDARREAARGDFERMVQLRPHDVRYLLPVVRDDLRQSAISPDRLAEQSTSLRNRVQAALQLDPRNGDAHRLLAELLSSLHEYDEAIATLTELLGYQASDQERAITHFGIGQIYENGLNDPERALTHYLEANQLLTEPHPLRFQLPARLSYVQAWIEQGNRPEVER